MSEKTNKKFFINVLRRAFISEEVAYELWDMIRDEAMDALLEGKEVNLFDLALLREQVTLSHERNALGNRRIVVPDKSNIKSRVSRRLKNEWELIND